MEAVLGCNCTGIVNLVGVMLRLVLYFDPSDVYTSVGFWWGPHVGVRPLVVVQGNTMHQHIVASKQGLKSLLLRKKIAV